MSIRTRLIALALAIVLPGVIGALWGLNTLYKHQKQAAANSLVEISRAVASVVEKELARMEATLKALALAPALKRRDYRTFYDFAKSAAPSDERVVILSDTEGRPLLNTRVPFGVALPPSTYPFAALRAQARRDASLVSNLYTASIVNRQSFAVQVPVLAGNEVIAYLAMGSFADTLQKTLEEQHLPAGWNVSVLDRNGVIVARQMKPGEFVGSPGTEDLLSRIRMAPHGVFETTRLDGVKTFTAYAPVSNTGWTLAVSMPKSEIDARVIAALNVTVLLTAVLLVLSLFAAAYVGLTISRPIQHLVHLAVAMGRGEPIRAPRSGLLETRAVANELQHASERIRAANAMMEERVKEAVRESQRAHEAMLQNQKLEALGKLTGGIAHDFNNLLQTISAAIEVGLRLATVDMVKTAMQAAKRAVERATKLTRQLTTFGRGAVSAPQPVNLRAHITDFRDLIEGALRENIALTFEMAEGLWPVYVDPVQLELAMLNAAINARDAMPGPGSLTISATNETLRDGQVAGLSAGEYVRMRICDTGAGIPAEALPRVFEPFYTTKAVGKGSGLGLAQIYGFAKQSGGTATIESTSGAGTTLSIYMPRSAVDERPVKSAEAERPRDAGTRRTILFVEDDELVSEVVVPGLRSNGFDVITARNAASAIEAMRSESIDVVLSDIVMPGDGDGLYLAQQIRKIDPHVPIVLATGYSDALTASSSFRVLLKPYTLEEARAALETEMQKAAARRPRVEPCDAPPVRTT